MATVVFPFPQGSTVKLTSAVGDWAAGTTAYVIGYEPVLDTVDLTVLIRVADDVHGNFDLRVSPAKIAAL